MQQQSNGDAFARVDAKFAAKAHLVAAMAMLFAVLHAPTIAAETTTLTGKVTNVTLYRGQAMVTRELSLEGPPGSREIVVSDLPEHVVDSSLFAEGSDQIEVRAVRYRQRAVSEAPREEVRKLESQIDETRSQIEVNQRKKQLLAGQSSYLDKLEGFVAPTAKTELSKGVLDAEALERVTRFAFEKREELLQKQVTNEQEAKELAKQLNLLERKRAELTSDTSRTVREALVFIEKRGDAAEPIRLSYLVNQCGWSPSYTLRAASGGRDVLVECNALIRQMTGEAWDGVRLTLSTASPVLNADTPGLAPFEVTLVGEGTSSGSKLDVGQLADRTRAANAQKREAYDQFASAAGQQSPDPFANAPSAPPSQQSANQVSANWAAILAINDLQCIELDSKPAELRAMAVGPADGEEGPSLVYRFESQVSLASRADQQVVRIVRSDLASSFRYRATPVLTVFVYREAEITNDGELDLIAGPVTAYLDGQFVGRTDIPTVARGQTFVVGFGADPQLRARRELVDKGESFQGGNRELKFKYRLTIENSKGEPVMVSLLDRMPHSDRPADVRVALGKMTDPLSDEKLYVLREKPKGILRLGGRRAGRQRGCRRTLRGIRLHRRLRPQLSTDRVA